MLVGKKTKQNKETDPPPTSRTSFSWKSLVIIVCAHVSSVCALLRSNNNVKRQKKRVSVGKAQKGDEDNINEEMGAEDLKRGATMDKF